MFGKFRKNDDQFSHCLIVFNLFGTFPTPNWLCAAHSSRPDPTKSKVGYSGRFMKNEQKCTGLGPVFGTQDVQTIYKHKHCRGKATVLTISPRKKHQRSFSTQPDIPRHSNLRMHATPRHSSYSKKHSCRCPLHSHTPTFYRPRGDPPYVKAPTFIEDFQRTDMFCNVACNNKQI